MPASERLFNTVVGLNFLVWAALGMSTAGPAERFSGVRICVTLLNVVAGYLFLFRAPLRRDGSLGACALALPSFLLGGIAFRLSLPLATWPLHAQALFVAGTIVTIASMLNLGRSFAILPARRGIVTRGAYRVVRHPMYAGELILIAAMFSAGPTWLTVFPLLAAVPLVIVRILVEEHLLHQDDAYRDYSKTACWRLIPCVW